MKLVFATNNQNKVNEIKSLLGEGVEILSLKDIGCNEELPETQETLEGNALQKARYVADNYHVNCFADDTGLEVASLNGAPGVILLVMQVEAQPLKKTAINYYSN